MEEVTKIYPANKNKKVGFISSSGGHFEQLMMLKPLMETYDSFVVTEKTNYNNFSKDNRIYLLKQINRKEKLFLFILIMNIIYSISIFLKEKPDVLISTGVLSTIPLSIIAKLFKTKIIYIESFAKINSPTLTGKLLYKIADRFYVQWEPLLKYYPNAIYIGGIY